MAAERKAGSTAKKTGSRTGRQTGSGHRGKASGKRGSVSVCGKRGSASGRGKRKARYARSDDYRYLFILHNPPKNGKYRCAYCGRWISKAWMQVDHVVPVYGAGTLLGRILLSETDGVNDLSNLVPSCPECNKKKGASMSPVWRAKASLGVHGWYWVLRKVLFSAVLAGAVAIILAWFLSRAA